MSCSTVVRVHICVVKCFLPLRVMPSCTNPRIHTNIHVSVLHKLYNETFVTTMTMSVSVFHKMHSTRKERKRKEYPDLYSTLEIVSSLHHTPQPYNHCACVYSDVFFSLDLLVGCTTSVYNYKKIDAFFT